MESYEFKVNDDGTTIAYHYGRSGSCTCLEEWMGRTFEDFAAGMKGRGFAHYTERVDMGDGRGWTLFVWTR